MADKLKALIVGAGRMGAGFGLDHKSHFYLHAKTYDDVEGIKLHAFVEPNDERASWAQERWKVPCYSNLDKALEEIQPDIVSVCVQPDLQKQIMGAVDAFPSVKGIWCEKPWVSDLPKKPTQVNYCRRFDDFHSILRKALEVATNKRLVVMAKKDVHTVCHMTDLARFWKVDEFNYIDTPGEPGAYFLRFKFKSEWREWPFPKGGITGDLFMKKALENLMEVLRGKGELISPPENAVLSEEWANKILKG